LFVTTPPLARDGGARIDRTQTGLRPVDPAEAEAERSQRQQAEQSRAEQSRAEQSRPEQSRRADASGVGSRTRAEAASEDA